MRGIVAKHFRGMARVELKGETEAERNYAQDRNGSTIVHPNSFRALYLRLKGAYRRVRAFAGEMKAQRERNRKTSGNYVKQPEDRIAHIDRPLMFILQHCPPLPVTGLDGRPKRDPFTGQQLYEAHPVYASARRAAAHGRGDLVQKMARQFLPA
jgi:hypothetical protein